MSPAGLLAVFAALSVTALAIGAGFALLGAWLILPFAGLEILGLGLAFLQCARRFGEQELENGRGLGARRLEPAAGLSNRLRIGPGK